MSRIGKPRAREIIDDASVSIGRAGIDDDDLGAVAKAFQAFADAGGLIEADHRRA